MRRDNHPPPTGRTGHFEPIARPVTPNDILATWYHALGIPPDLKFIDRRGRPTAILPEGEAIRELIA